jgi:hypothetical protein
MGRGPFPSVTNGETLDPEATRGFGVLPGTAEDL